MSVNSTNRLGSWVWGWLEKRDPYTNVVGTARTLLALGTCGTLAFTSPLVLFGNNLGSSPTPFGIGPGRVGLFYLLTSHLELARWIAVGILLVAATGWRPRVTCIFHWWIAFSLQSSATILDGGDQITAILTLLLIPVALTDGRAWHWNRRVTPRFDTAECLRRMVAVSALLAIRIQVAGIYFHSAVLKLSVREWVDGTAVYYWFTNPSFGAPAIRKHLLMPLLLNGGTVAAISWGAIVLELILFMALTMPKKAWKPLLILGIGFHILIALVFGLISFSIAMCAALVLYLRPVENAFLIPTWAHIVPVPSSWRKFPIRAANKPALPEAVRGA